MSESDIDDMLLELAGEGEREKKKKRRSPNSGNSASVASKRRKAEVSGDSDDDEDDAFVDPYPLEGKYSDEEDRQRLLQLSEIEREEIITQRLEEKQRLQDRLAVSQMVREQKAGTDLSDSVSRAAKRQRTQRGATKEKSRTLDELKARRKAKGDKQRSKNHSPKRDRSSSPTDMEISDGESEDGQITKDEQEEERERRLLKQTPAAEEAPAAIADLEKCRLSRDALAKYCFAPWFEQYAQSAWVRYLIGQESGQPVYRICEIASLLTEPVKPYRLNDQTVNMAFELKHGSSAKTFLMDKVSNSPFLPKEFERLTKVCRAEDIKLPSKQSLEKKATVIANFIAQRYTDADVNQILKRKGEVEALVKKPTGLSTIERSRLVQARTLAIRRQDEAEVKALDAKLAEYENSADAPAPDSRHGTPSREDKGDVLARVNERNRKANSEAVRRAELAESERKRKERKAMMQGGGGETSFDPSARLKTVPRLFNAATPSSRPGTPAPKGAGTPPPTKGSTAANGSAAPKPYSPTKKIGQSWEKSFIDSVEVDLGDF